MIFTEQCVVVAGSTGESQHISRLLQPAERIRARSQRRQH